MRTCSEWGDNSSSSASQDGICPRGAKWGKFMVIFVGVGLLGMFIAFLNDAASSNTLKSKMDTIKVDLLKDKDLTSRKMTELKDSLETLHEKHRALESDAVPRSKKKDRKIIAKCPERYQKVIKDALLEYDADKTGRTDFALGTAGAKICHTRGTENYPTSRVKFLGITLCTNSNNPNMMLQPGNLPGECWAFRGHTGSAVIELIGKVFITSVSLEHIPKSLSPTGKLHSAPKEFSIYGLRNTADTQGHFFGKFTYDIDGPPLQNFEIDGCFQSFRLVEFVVHSNHGNPDYTCIYRLRVHGELDGSIYDKSGTCS